MFALSISAQERNKFEVKLSDFRYSLYEDIANSVSDSLPYETAIDQVIYSNPVISAKLEDFMNDNKQAIVAYKTNILKQHRGDIKIDTMLYDMELFMIEELNVFFNDESFIDFLSYNISTIEFITINPIAIGSLFNSLISGQRTMQSIAINSIANQIAAPKLFSKHIHDDLWEVTYDYCWYIIVVEMDLSKGLSSIQIKAVYRQKGLPNII